MSAPGEVPIVGSGDSDGPGGAGDSGEANSEANRPRLVTENERGLVAVNLGKRFDKRPVLRGVSLSINRGEVVGLLGPNGAGKTTCFYLITGLIAGDYGSVHLDGQDITDLPMYRRARLGIRLRAGESDAPSRQPHRRPGGKRRPLPLDRRQVGTGMGSHRLCQSVDD